MSISSKSLCATFSRHYAKNGVDAFIRKIELGGSALSDALSNLDAYQLYLACLNEKDPTKPWFAVMKENFVKTTCVWNLEQSIDRVHRKLKSALGLVTEDRKLKTVSELVQDNKILFQVQLLLHHTQMYFTEPQQLIRSA